MYRKVFRHLRSCRSTLQYSRRLALCSTSFHPEENEKGLKPILAVLDSYHLSSFPLTEMFEGPVSADPRLHEMLYQRDKIIMRRRKNLTRSLINDNTVQIV